jgi:hypothetical protein
MFRASGPRSRREEVRRLSREGLLVRVGRKRDMETRFANGCEEPADVWNRETARTTANYQANRLLRRRWMPLACVGPRRDRA